MYRDTATALDEHDRAVGAILIGEALVEECDRAILRIRQPEATGHHDRWRSVADVHDAYPEIWRHLDRARRVLAQRGANVIAYDELRPNVRRNATVEAAEALDLDTLDEAKRAIADLKLAVPGADWKAIAARTDGLIRTPLGSRKRRQRAAVGAVLIAFVFALVAWFLAIVPVHKVSRVESMHRELAGIRQQRGPRIEFLRTELGDRCLPIVAREMMRLLVLDGRGPDAKAFAAGYTSRCGDDLVIDHWANAPRPGH